MSQFLIGDGVCGQVVVSNVDMANMDAAVHVGRVGAHVALKHGYKAFGGDCSDSFAFGGRVAPRDAYHKSWRLAPAALKTRASVSLAVETHQSTVTTSHYPLALSAPC